MSSSVGRLVVDVQTNKSGGAVAYGDVVINSTANDHAFTTTTSAGFTGGIVGVCIEPNGIADNATGRVQLQGYVAQINCNASVTRGYFLATHTVAKQAAGSASRGAGSFGVTLKTSASPDAVLWGLPDVSAGSLTDHTHAATGSGANGGGATLSPVTLNLPTAAPATTEGQAGWSTALHGLSVFDSVQAKGVTPVGFAVSVMFPGIVNTDAFSTATNLAAVSATLAGCTVQPVTAFQPFSPYDFEIWSTDTASARAAEVALYYDALDNSASLTRVPNSASTFSFTPGAAALQHSGTITAAGVLPPGQYYIAIRNTSASQTFGVGTSGTSGTGTFAVGCLRILTASYPALGATLDITAGSLGGTRVNQAVRVRCLVAGQAAPTF